MECYKAASHLQCSETFYRDNIMDELKIDQNSTESKEKMLEILKRMHEENRVHFSDSDTDADEPPFQFSFKVNDMDEDLDSDDNETPMDIADRLAGVDLDDAEQVWEKLTEDEKQEFMSFLK